jgi:hypothetical protein
MLLARAIVYVLLVVVVNSQPYAGHSYVHNVLLERYLNPPASLYVQPARPDGIPFLGIKSAAPVLLEPTLLVELADVHPA